MKAKPPDSTATSRRAPRSVAIRRVELAALALRYAGCLLAVALWRGGHLPFGPAALAVLLGFNVAHVLFTHYVLTQPTQWLFSTTLNFALHFVGVTVLVGVTGAAESGFAPFYAALIVGYCVYTPRFQGTYRITLLCIAAYALVFTFHAVATGEVPGPGAISINLAYILASGLLMDALGRRVRTAEEAADRRARALASSEATLRTILDSTPGPILVYDEDEFIAEANDGAVEFLGLPRDMLVGRRFREFLFDDGTLPRKMANLRTHGMYHGEELLVSEDGSERSVDLRIRSFIRDEQRFSVVILHDITEQKNVQERARLSAVRLEEINAELARVNHLRSAFFATVSQRLRSPLTAVLGLADLLLGEELGELNGQQRKALQSCRRSVLRTFSLVDDASSLDAPAHETTAPPDDAEQGR